VPADVLEGSVVVVIDILRATTTMTTGLANGAARIVPCVGVDQAHLTKQHLLAQFESSLQQTSPKTAPHPNGDAAATAEPGDHGSRGPSVLLGGERLGRPLPGFDLSNAPATYSPAAVAGRSIVMTTTNGTRAMDLCRGAKEIVIGSFANLSRVIDHLNRAQQVVLVCSGTDRHVTCEDVLFAGAVTSRLLQASRRPATAGQSATPLAPVASTRAASTQAVGERTQGPSAQPLPVTTGWQLNDASELARVYWEQLPADRVWPTAEEILQVFRQSLGGSNLIAQGRQQDLEFAAAIDRFDNLPVLDQGSWEIKNHFQNPPVI